MRAVIKHGAVALAGVLVLSACSVGPDYARPVAAAPAARFLRGQGLEAAPAAPWWTGLGDAGLNGLIEQGLTNAPQMSAAQARVRQARAGLRNARAGQWPALGADAGYLHADLPGFGAGDFFNTGFDAQWEIDIWGGKRRGVEQARAQLAVVEAQRGDAEVSLAAEIARTYVTLRAREASRSLLAQRHEVEAQWVRIAGQKLAAGTNVRQTLEGARATLSRTEGEQAAVAADIGALRDALAVLTGQAPGALDGLGAGAVPLPPEVLALGDPGAMLARRPDVRAAERAYAGATAGVGVAMARRYPTVSLMGVIGFGGTKAGDAIDPSSFASLIAPTLRWNFPSFGRVEAGVQSARGARDLALAQYQGAVLAALQDAESALGRYGAARVSWVRSGAAAGHGTEIARLQAMRGAAGTLGQGDVLAARRDAINARLAQENDRASMTLAYVALSKALGLGWGTQSAKAGG